MVARGVFIETSDGRFYVDEESARVFVKRRWQRMLIFLAFHADSRMPSLLGRPSRCQVQVLRTFQPFLLS